MIDAISATLSTLTAFILLAAPGPAIAALVALGRLRGFRPALRYYFGLEAGFSLAAALCALGILSVAAQAPTLVTILTYASTAYLMWIAYEIATAPLQTAPDMKDVISIKSTARAGFLYGFSNPKGYLLFATLFSTIPVSSSPITDKAFKLAACVVIMFGASFIYLRVGTLLRGITLPSSKERFLNVAMGISIVVTAALPMLGIVKPPLV